MRKSSYNSHIPQNWKFTGVTCQQEMASCRTGQYVVEEAYFQHTDLISNLPVGTYGSPEQCLKENTTLTAVKSKTSKQNGFGKSFPGAAGLVKDSLQVCKMSAFKTKLCSNFMQVTITLPYCISHVFFIFKCK